MNFSYKFYADIAPSPVDTLDFDRRGPARAFKALHVSASRKFSSSIMRGDRLSRMIWVCSSVATV